MTINYFEIPEGADAKVVKIENRFVVRYTDTMCITRTMPCNRKMNWDVYSFLSGGEDYTDADRVKNIVDYSYDRQTAERIAREINANAPKWMTK